MPFAQRCVTWLRQTFAWSNSRESWEERLGTLLLIAGVAGAFLFGSLLSGLQLFLLWAVVLLASAVLLRHGWLKLFGPVLFYDMVRAARQGRYFLLRFAYAALLLFLLYTTYLDHRYAFHGNNVTQAARMAQQFFETFMIVQFLAVGVLTPAYVAGAIADEKDRKTLEYLLATDLRNREIVLGKLVSRLANLTLFLLTGLPLLSLLQFLGGVDPGLVLYGFATVGMTMLSLGGLSILNSTTMRKPRDAIASTYLMGVAFLVLSLLAYLGQLNRLPILETPLWFGEDPPTLNDVVDGFTAGNIFLLLPKIREAGARGRLDVVVPELFRSYALFHGLVAVVCTTWAVLRVRAIAIQQAHGKTRKAGLLTRAIGRPPVGHFPMLWKEIYAEGGLRLNWLGLFILAGLMIGTFLPVAFIIGDHLSRPYDFRYAWNNLGAQVNVWVRTVGTIISCLTLLAVAVRASTSISGERDRQTIDALLTTPLDSATILFGKWVGSILSVRITWIWLALIWGVGIVTDGLHLLALPALIWAWLVYAGFVAALGLWFSTVARTSLRATIFTLLATAGLAVGHWLPWMCCAFSRMPMGDGGRYIAEFQAGCTPPAALAFLAFRGEDLSRHYGGEFMSEMLGFSLVGTFVWAFGTGIVWSATSLRFRQLTNRTGALDLIDRPSSRTGPRPPSRPPELSPRPFEPPLPHSTTTLPQGAFLVEETWEPPRRRTDEDEDESEDPWPPKRY